MLDASYVKLCYVCVCTRIPIKEWLALLLLTSDMVENVQIILLCAELLLGASVMPDDSTTTGMYPILSQVCYQELEISTTRRRKPIC
jgi:hypothetical protein